MATATIENVFCIRPSSGTDFDVLTALANLAASIVPDVFQLDESIKSLPAVAAAIDTAGEYADDLYFTKTTYGGLDNSFWPLDRETMQVETGTSALVNRSIEVELPQNVSLWDEDLSGDEHVGSIQIEDADQGQGSVTKLAKNDAQGSAYYVTYRVD